MVVSLLPEEAPIEPLPEVPEEVLGEDDEELVSLLPVLLPVVLEDGELDVPVPEAPMDDELLLGVLDELVEGEAPIVVDDDLSVALAAGVLVLPLLAAGAVEPVVLLEVLGVLLLVPVLLPLVAAEPELLPAEVPALPAPELWAMARLPNARAAAAARAVRVVLVALILNSLMELSARESGGDGRRHWRRLVRRLGCAPTAPK